MKLFRFLKAGSPYFGFRLIGMGVISGIAGTSSIAIVNEVIARNQGSTHYYPLLFGGYVLAMLVYLLVQRYYQGTLIRLSENLIWQIRLSVLQQVRKADFVKYQQYGSDKLFTTLTSDASVVSYVATVLAYAATSAVIVVSCLVYLAFLSLTGFALTLGVMGVSLTLYWVRQRGLTKKMKAARQREGEFYEYIQQLLSGIKEVKMDSRRSDDLYDNYIKKAALETELLKTGSNIGHADNSLVGQFAFHLVILLVLFAFPYFQVSFLEQPSQFILVILYLLGPVQGLAQLLPQFTYASLAVGKIEEVKASISSLEEEAQRPAAAGVAPAFESLRFQEVGYYYPSGTHAGDKSFGIGPVDLEINRGEILFLCGGNGSGKSTFIKLLTGLYHPSEGSILLNGKPVNPSDAQHYRNCFAPIFTDNYLFDRLYGQPLADEDAINRLIAKLELGEKVRFANNQYSTIRLSEGQKKRIALISSLAEYKSIYVFDEWAANQDPEFKDYFYRTLLPELKREGKTVIAVTHDDKYFDVADRLIKMEFGKLKLSGGYAARSAQAS